MNKRMSISVRVFLYLELVMTIIAILNPRGKLNFTDDGAFYYLARKIPMWGSAFDISVFQPGNGLTNIFGPTNFWSNPGYLMIGYIKPEYIGVLLAQLYFAAILYFSFIFLIRVFEVPEKSGAIYAAIAVIFLNKPFGPSVLQLFILFDNNSPLSQTVSLMNVILGLYILLGRKNLEENIFILTSLVLLFIYMLWSDLLWCVLVAAPLIFYGLVFLGKSIKENLWKISAGLICLGIFVGFGFLDYLVTIQGFMSRRIFTNEIYGEMQDWSYASSYFHLGRVRTLMKIVLYSSIVGIFLIKNRQQKRLALGTLLSLGTLMAVSYYYVKKAGNWTYPLPLYFENSFYFFWGLSSFLVIASLNPVKWFVNFIKTPRMKAARIFAVILLTVSFFQVLFRDGHKHLIGKWIGRPNDSTQITEYLKKNIAITPGSDFRGLVTTHINVVDGVPHNKMVNQSREYENYYMWGNPHVLSGLWFYDIPTLDEYNHLYTPFLHILFTRLLSREYDYHSKNFLFTTNLNTNILRMLGVRYVITDKVLDKGYAEQVSLTNPKATYSLRLYEIPDVNLANYSPTDIKTESHVAQVLKILRDENFDPRKTAVLFENFTQPLVQAEHSKLSYHKDYLRFEGSSKGTSLVVLPIQFSRCLNSNDPNIQLLRTNIAEAGIVFKGDVNVEIRFDLGVGNTDCRKKDINDVYAYGLKDMEENLFPKTYMIPHGWSDYGYENWKKLNSCDISVKIN